MLECKPCNLTFRVGRTCRQCGRKLINELEYSKPKLREDVDIPSYDPYGPLVRCSRSTRVEPQRPLGHPIRLNRNGKRLRIKSN